MRKRMAAVLGALFLLVGYCLPAAAVTDVSGAYCEEAVMNLEALGIVTAYEDGTFREAEPMTRAEFASIVVRALGMEGVLPPDGQVRFDDVPQAHWAYESIMAAVRLGLMDGFSDTTFAPEENLSYEQAAKVLTCLTGYRVAAEGLGGYPAGYNIVAGNLRLMRGITASMTSDATRGDLAVMLFRAMQVDVMIQALDHDGYQKAEGNTLLDAMLSRASWERHEGQVTANSITGLDGSSDLRPGQIEIDGQMFDAGGLALDDLLGMHVQYYYSREEGCLTAAFALSTDNDELVLEGEDITSLTANAIVYERDGSTETESLQSGTSILYNNEAVVVFDDTTGRDLVPAEGKVRLLDSDCNGAYDVVFIEEAQSFVVKSISPTKGIIYIDDVVNQSDFYGKTAIYLRLDDSDYCHMIRDKDGKSMELEQIGEGDVISVIAGKNEKYIEVTKLEDYVEGYVSEINSDGVATINGQSYELAKNKDGTFLLEMAAGDNGRYYLNRYGRIFASLERTSETVHRGFVIAQSLTGGIENALSLKLIAPGVAEKQVGKNEYDISYNMYNTEMLILDCEEPIRLNGNRIKAEEIENLSGQAIEYVLGADGRIRRIDTLGAFSPKLELYFNSEITSFGGTSDGGFLMDDQTVVYCVPKNVDASDDDYFVQVTLKNNGRYEVQAFDVDPDTQVAGAVVVNTNMRVDGSNSLDQATVCIIKELSYSVDEDGNEVHQIRLYDDGEDIELKSNGNGSLEEVLNTLAVGDLICYSKDAFGRMNQIKVICRTSGLSVPFHTDEFGKNEQIFAHAKRVKSNTFSSVKNEMVDEITVEDENVSLKTVSVPKKDAPPVFSFDQARGRVSLADAADINTTENTGEDANFVYIAARNNDVRAVVIFE